MDFKDFVLQHGSKDLDFWHKARLQLIGSLLDRVEEKERILDVGCGTGTELPLLLSHGDVTAIDTERRALAQVEKLGCKTLLSDITTAPLPAGHFDVVGCFDVLEHIQDDRAAMRNIYSGLKPGGYFLLTVPAFQWLFSDHDRALEHCRRYGKSEITEKLTQAGFSITYLRYWNSLLFPLIALVRLFKKLAKGYASEGPISEMQPVSPAIDKLLYCILGLEARGLAGSLCSLLPFGVSLAVIAYKSKF
jgi:SAM-dependent methyltransferase